MSDADSGQPSEIEQQYNPRLAVPGFEAFFQADAERSAATRERRAHRADVRYGDGPLQTLDVFPGPKTDGPIHVFIHGGYWRALDKASYSFVADTFCDAGATTVLLNYDLCPAVTVDTVVAETLDGLAWVYRNAQDLGGNPDRICISGHSAGAHLAAMALAHDWSRHDLPATPFKAAALISGIYDPMPVLEIAANADIRLDADMAQRNNAITHLPRPGTPFIVAVGGGETRDWIRQSSDYHEACRAAGLQSTYMRVGTDHHFSITDRLADPDHPMTRAIIGQMGL